MTFKEVEKNKYIVTSNAVTVHDIIREILFWAKAKTDVNNVPDGKGKVGKIKIVRAGHKDIVVAYSALHQLNMLVRGVPGQVKPLRPAVVVATGHDTMYDFAMSFDRSMLRNDTINEAVKALQK